MSTRTSWGRQLGLIGAFVGLLSAGCQFGPKMLEHSYGPYNEAVKQVAEEQLLTNIVRLRYNDNATRLNVSAITAQYDLTASSEMRPFFATNARGPFSRVLPDAAVSTGNRPTLTIQPRDDAETLRAMNSSSSLAGILFLSETSYPVGTVFRLMIYSANRVPNAVTAIGPGDPTPVYQEFLRAALLLQKLHDQGDIHFKRGEQVQEIGDPIPESKFSSANQVDAAKAGLEYRRRGSDYVLTRKRILLQLFVNPRVAGSTDAQELLQLLHLTPGHDSYSIAYGGEIDPYAREEPAAALDKLHLFPRSVTQATWYASHGVIPPSEHVASGVVPMTKEADGKAFDWQQVMGGLFTVHHAKQHCRPDHAFVAIRYRSYWFYIDDRDQESKITFSLLLLLSRANLLERTGRDQEPLLTLPVGR